MNQKYRIVSFDGCNGWRLGEVVTLKEYCEREEPKLTEDDFYDRNGDGLLETDDGETLLVPVD